MNTLLTALRLLGALMLVTGGLYPLAVWSVARVVFPRQAGGSLVVRDGLVVGSELLAQKTTAPRYFHPRPSAVDFATVASGASNQAWTSAALAQAIAQRRAAYPTDAAVSADLLTASASGLDPHLSPEAVRLQVGRVAVARGLDARQRASLDELVARLTVGGQFSPARLNVLALNLALDTCFPGP